MRRHRHHPGVLGVCCGRIFCTWEGWARHLERHTIDSLLEAAAPPTEAVAPPKDEASVPQPRAGRLTPAGTDEHTLERGLAGDDGLLDSFDGTQLVLEAS